MDLSYANLFDRLSLPMLFLLTLLLQGVFIEIGFQLGTRNRHVLVKPQVSQVRAIMGAGLGLTAFMLAFTFAVGQDHYEARVHAMVEEARVLRTAFLQAEHLSPSARDDARALLREYAGDRVRLRSLVKERKLEQAGDLVVKSEALQGRLWDLAVGERDKVETDGSAAQTFEASVINLIDLHVQRLEASLMNRIPNVLWITLYLTSALSMLVMGYQAGLVSRRSPYATVTLAIAFSAVLMLIMDLDRPVMTLFEINIQALVDVVERMDAMLGTANRGS